MWLERDLVMLPTNEKANIILDRGILEYIEIPQVASTINSDVKGFNLYILSDEEIKDGDWFVNPKYGYKRKRFKKKTDWDGVSVTKCFKIIATNDKSLTITEDLGEISIENILPQIHQSFIEHFVSEYRKKNIVTKVKVEHERFKRTKLNGSKIDCGDIKLKTNQKDNTINIKPIKDSWNIKEMEDIHVSVVKQGCLYEGGTWSDEDERLVRLEFKKWIKENL